MMSVAKCRKMKDASLVVAYPCTNICPRFNCRRLRDIREDLEELTRNLEEDAPEEIDERLVYGYDEDEDEDDEDDDKDMEDVEVTSPRDTGATIPASAALQPETHVTPPIRNQHERYDEEGKIGERSAAKPPRIHVESQAEDATTVDAAAGEPATYSSIADVSPADTSAVDPPATDMSLADVSAIDNSVIHTGSALYSPRPRSAPTTLTRNTE